MRVYDLMSGMGELWRGIARNATRAGSADAGGAKLGSGEGTDTPICQIDAVDISAEMCRLARRSSSGWLESLGIPLAIHEVDMLDNHLPSASADVIVSAFGVKTFSPVQREVLAHEIHRLLKPGGQFALLEISVPDGLLHPWLRFWYMFYVKRIIPGIGRLFLGNPANYRMLGVYTEAFGNVEQLADCLRETGLSAQVHPHFFGCATAVAGKK